jgi:hypothetical protein
VGKRKRERRARVNAALLGALLLAIAAELLAAGDEPRRIVAGISVALALGLASRAR